MEPQRTGEHHLRSIVRGLRHKTKATEKAIIFTDSSGTVSTAEHLRSILRRSKAKLVQKAKGGSTLEKRKAGIISDCQIQRIDKCAISNMIFFIIITL